MPENTSILDRAIADSGNEPLIPPDRSLAFVPKPITGLSIKEGEEAGAPDVASDAKGEVQGEEGAGSAGGEQEAGAGEVGEKVPVNLNGSIHLVDPRIATEMKRLEGNVGTVDVRNESLKSELSDIRKALEARVTPEVNSNGNGTTFTAPDMPADLVQTAAAIDAHLTAGDPEMAGKISALMSAVHSSAITAAHAANHEENQGVLDYVLGEIYSQKGNINKAVKLHEMFELQTAIAQSGHKNLHPQTVIEVRQILRENALKNGETEAELDSKMGQKYLTQAAIDESVHLVQEELRGGTKRTPNAGGTPAGTEDPNAQLNKLLEQAGIDPRVVETLLAAKGGTRHPAGSIDPRRLQHSQADINSRGDLGGEDIDTVLDANKRALLKLKQIGLAT